MGIGTTIYGVVCSFINEQVGGLFVRSFSSSTLLLTSTAGRLGGLLSQVQRGGGGKGERGFLLDLFLLP